MRQPLVYFLPARLLLCGLVVLQVHRVQIKVIRGLLPSKFLVLLELVEILQLLTVYFVQVVLVYLFLIQLIRFEDVCFHYLSRVIGGTDLTVGCHPFIFADGPQRLDITLQNGYLRLFRLPDALHYDLCLGFLQQTNLLDGSIVVHHDLLVQKISVLH